MKHKYKLFLTIIVSLLPLIAACIGIFILPDQIPVHWTNGQSDRIGSKWELLVCPVCFLLLSFITYQCVRVSGYLSRPFSDKAMDTLFLLSVSVVFALLFLLTCGWIYQAYDYSVSPLPSFLGFPDSEGRLGFLICGIILFACGVVLRLLPKEKCSSFMDKSLGHPVRGYKTGYIFLMMLGLLLILGNILISTATASLLYSLFVIILGGFFGMIAVVIASC